MLEIVGRAGHAPGSIIMVGVGPEAYMPGLRSETPQAEMTARHIRVSYGY